LLHDFVSNLTENPDQVRGPANASRDGVIICAQMAFKALSAPDGPANGGSFRPLKVITRPGTVFDAREPDRLLLRGRGACVRSHAALPRAAYAGSAAGRQFRFDLWNGDRRTAS
jgi:N-methylhydantoinase B/oxoprolinase/acetone carboxylase alpha subunit